ncbi:hypothetical protein GUITHDRAFT_120116 [Guillardia theta CCMP2712]|uniref:Uncharacterized protein n=1 Tax=Guillardia theta (strain CCMP2712) TaxID=905079 RepID=L1IC36_GUITC|nr:hypothetical protein GUITHDRAFT_120116 [Guillardia theta CCMP2712]EKX33667.1 hypothetical protein GUITHDRAFT_120116 [Guillardia theta CCMP2712]|eukprot:XP_005820647.1 hypothetical protein GUITHDRAFT_120116 [Guillardia theta CCMP2712]
MIQSIQKAANEASAMASTELTRARSTQKVNGRKGSNRSSRVSYGKTTELQPNSSSSKETSRSSLPGRMSRENIVRMDDAQYQGEVIDGKAHGQWENDLMHGQGSYMWNDAIEVGGGMKKLVLKASCKDMRCQTPGRERGILSVDSFQASARGSPSAKRCSIHGTRYQGEFERGVKNGYGTLSMQDGSKYEGMWQNNRFQGKASRSFSEGRFALR